MGRLFAYGTLQVRAVMEALIARVPEGIGASLRGYARYRLAGQVFPGILADPTACVEGILYSEMTEAELDVIDTFEDGMYVRRLVQVQAGGRGSVPAFTYALKDDEVHRAERRRPWSLDGFISESGARYVESCAAFRLALDERRGRV